MAAYRYSLKGKRVLLSGGTTGIGREVLALLASEGARLITFGRNPDSLNDALRNAEADDEGTVQGIIADITRTEDVAKVFALVDAEFAGLDIFISNAALGADPVHDLADAEWRYIVETNLVGTIDCTREAIARMRRGGGGHLAFVSSIATDIKKPGESLYAATKAGVEALALTLRKELKDENIRVSVIQPGSVRTPMQECSDEAKDRAVSDMEMLEPQDVAEAIHFALTRPPRAAVVNLRLEPVRQKTS